MLNLASTCAKTLQVVIGGVFGFFSAAVEAIHLNRLHFSSELQVKHLKVSR